MAGLQKKGPQHRNTFLFSPLPGWMMDFPFFEIDPFFFETENLPRISNDDTSEQSVLVRYELLERLFASAVVNLIIFPQLFHRPAIVFSLLNFLTLLLIRFSYILNQGYNEQLSRFSFQTLQIMPFTNYVLYKYIMSLQAIPLFIHP